MTKTLARAAALLLAIGVLAAPAVAPAAEPTLAWSDILAGDADLLDDGYCALTDPDGHLIVAGESANAGGGTDIYVRKLSRVDKTQMWDARYEAFDDNDMAVTDMCFDPFGDVLIGGYIRGCLG